MVATYILLLSSLGLVIMVQAQDCLRPLGGPNMNLKEKDILLQTFPDGIQVSFTCEIGYVSAGGSAVITCTAGTWSPVMLKCERRPCGSIGDVENGDVHYTNGTQFGDSVLITCKTGFILVGKSKIRCGDKGWENRLPLCEVVTCKPPPTVVDGTFSPNKEHYNYREVVLYTCRKDYALNGSNSISCSEDETFKPGPPTCVNFQCQDPKIPHAEWIGGSRPPHTYQATVTYQCKSGYEMIGDRTIVCEINGQWSPGLPRCQPQDCPKPVGGPNMSLKEKDILLQTFPDGTQVTFACDVGYVSAGGSAVITCTAGSWSRVQLKCETQDCPKPVGGPNMSLKEKDILLQTFPDGTQVTFACDVGYVSAGGSAVITCTTGSWNRVQLKCEKVICDNPDIENAQRIGDSQPPYRYKDTVTYQCKSGYTMKGVRTLECGANGQWSAELPRCEQDKHTDNNSGNNGHTYVKPLGIAVGVAIGILFLIGLYYFGVPAIKKRLGSRRGYPDNEAKDGEGVALS